MCTYSSLGYLYNAIIAIIKAPTKSANIKELDGFFLGQNPLKMFLRLKYYLKGQ
jgi:hypothetical protein